MNSTKNIDNPEAKKLNAVYIFKLGNDSYTINLRESPAWAKKGAHGKADCTIITGEKEFLELATGKAKGQTLFMQGKLKISGNMGLALKLDTLFKQLGGADKAKAVPAAAPAAPAPAAAATSGFKSAAVFDQIKGKVASDASLVKAVNGVYLFEIAAGGKKENWTVDLKTCTPGTVKQGAHGKPDVTITVDDDNFVALSTGKANPQTLFMQGKLKIKGNMGLAMKLDKIIKGGAKL